MNQITFLLSCKPMHVNRSSSSNQYHCHPSSKFTLNPDRSCNSGTGVFTSSHAARLICLLDKDCCDCRYLCMMNKPPNCAGCHCVLMCFHPNESYSSLGGLLADHMFSSQQNALHLQGSKWHMSHVTWFHSPRDLTKSPLLSFLKANLPACDCNPNKKDNPIWADPCTFGCEM